jgi:hypothetical protein
MEVMKAVRGTSSIVYEQGLSLAERAEFAEQKCHLSEQAS